MMGGWKTFYLPLALFCRGKEMGVLMANEKKFNGARLTIQEGSTKSCKNCIKLFPYAPWAWNIYLSLLQVYGTCRQIFHSWGASGIRSNTLNRGQAETINVSFCSKRVSRKKQIDAFMHSIVMQWIDGCIFERSPKNLLFSLHLHKHTLVNSHSNGTWSLWRCVSYWTLDIPLPC